uniref:Tectonic domain-containing protein n=1 Tax=Phaeomonas parva TaxID=124430 RepID=A0A7S1TPI6_9STRA|mmetsp:Transcript_11866/g.35982  ORF Transcript_11866/g.35982 Transcript_11866/m.35982 type:complete len:669 (+) Transcript_11866:232-2238(+)
MVSTSVSLAALALFASFRLAFAQNPTFGCSRDDFYAMDTALFYQEDSLLPPSCTCQESFVGYSSCTKFECECTCDLNAGMCDYNCCCDTECSTEQIARFEELGACLPEGPADSVITECASTEDLAEINPSFPLRVKDTADQSLDQMLCVQTDNSELKGEFFADPGSPSASVFDSDDGSKDYSYEPTTASTTSIDDTYDLGETILAGHIPNGTSDGFYRAWGGHLSIPTADESGVCNPLSFGKYEEPVYEPNSCIQVFDDLADACDNGGALDLRTLARDLYIGTTPESALTASADYVRVEIDDYTFEEWGTGTDVTDAAITVADVQSCGSFYTSAGDTTGPAGCAITANAVTTAEAACRYAVKSICYTITHDATAIVNASATVVLTDIPTTAVDATTSMYYVEQETTLEFGSTLAVTTSQNNVIARTRSGNPGYIFGMPVLSGYLVATETDTGIRARVPGLTLPGSPFSLNCPADADVDDADFRTQVNFGIDARSGCKLSLTLAELEDFCDGTSTLVSSNVPINLETNDSYVGEYGNSDPLDRSAWVSVEATSTVTAPVWSSTTQTCTDLVTGVHYRILWAYTGTTENRQPKIITVEKVYSTETVQWLRPPGAPSDVEQPLFLTSTATFVEYVTSSAEYTPPAPPIIFSVPYDVFYPFEIGSEEAPPSS